NSTVTATLAGQIVMEGFIDIRLPPWARRLTTRAVAIVPAAAVTIWYGESGTAKLLILSQVILGLALPFAIVPLVMFTADRAKMGDLVAPRWLTWASALTAAVLIVLNIKLLYDLIPADCSPHGAKRNAGFRDPGFRCASSGVQSRLIFKSCPPLREQPLLRQEAAL